MGDLRYTLENLRPSLTQPETEESWDSIARSIQTLSGLCTDACTDSTSTEQIVTFSRSIFRPLISALNSERTRLSGTAVDLFTHLASSLGPAFDSLLPTFFPAILLLTARSNKVFITRARSCLFTIIESTQLPSILTYLSQSLAGKEKSTTLRLAAIEGVMACLNCYNPLELEKEGRAKEVEISVKTTATDANAEVRKFSRKVFEAYKELMPHRVENFTAPLSPTMRKYLDIKGVAKPITSTATHPTKPSHTRSASTSALVQTTSQPEITRPRTKSRPAPPTHAIAATDVPRQTKPTLSASASQTHIVGTLMAPPDFIPQRSIQGPPTRAATTHPPTNSSSSATIVPSGPRRVNTTTHSDSPSNHNPPSTSSLTNGAGGASRAPRVALPTTASEGPMRGRPIAAPAAHSSTDGPRRVKREVPVPVPTPPIPEKEEKLKEEKGIEKVPSSSREPSTSRPNPKGDEKGQFAPAKSTTTKVVAPKAKAAAPQATTVTSSKSTIAPPKSSVPAKGPPPAAIKKSASVASLSTTVTSKRTTIPAPVACPTTTASGSGPTTRGGALPAPTLPRVRSRAELSKSVVAPTKPSTVPVAKEKEKKPTAPVTSNKPSWGRATAASMVKKQGASETTRALVIGKKPMAAAGAAKGSAAVGKTGNAVSKVKPESVPLPSSPVRRPISVPLPPSPEPPLEAQPQQKRDAVEKEADIEERPSTPEYLPPPTSLPPTSPGMPETDENESPSIEGTPVAPLPSSNALAQYQISLVDNTSATTTPISSLLSSIQRGFLFTPGSPLSPPMGYANEAGSGEFKTGFGILPFPAKKLADVAHGAASGALGFGVGSGKGGQERDGEERGVLSDVEVNL